MFTDEQYDKIWQVRQSKLLANLSHMSPVVYEDKNKKTWYFIFIHDKDAGHMVFMASSLESEAALTELLFPDRLKYFSQEDLMYDERRLELIAHLAGYQLAFNNTDNVTEEDANAFRTYAKKRRIATNGSHRFPQGAVIRRGCPIAPLKSTDLPEFMSLIDALIGLASLIRTDNFTQLSKLGFSIQTDSDAKTTVRLEENDGKWSLSPCSRGHHKETLLPAAEGENEIERAKVKKMHKTGTWNVRLIRYVIPITWGEDKEYVLPEQLFILNSSYDYIPVQPVAFYETRGDVCLNVLMKAIGEQNICPKKIRTDDENTFHFLEGFCKRVGIQIIFSKKRNEDMDDAIRDFLMFTAGDVDDDYDLDDLDDLDLDDMDIDETVDEMLQILEIIMALSDNDIYNLPPDMKQGVAIICMTAMAVDVPEDFLIQLEAALKKIERAEKKHGKKLVDFFDGVMDDKEKPASDADFENIINLEKARNAGAAKHRKPAKRGKSKDDTPFT